MNDSELSTALRSVISSLHKGLRKQLYSANTYSMTELDTIRHLFLNSSLLPTELAELTRIKRQSISQILNKLEAQGMVERKPSEQDKRKVYVSLTEKGRELVEKVRYDRDEWLKTVIEKNLNEEDKQLLTQVLPVLNKLIAKKQG